MEQTVKIIGEYDNIKSLLPKSEPTTKNKRKQSTYLYLFRLGNNHIKGGQASNPQARLKSHSQAAEYYGGTKIKETAVFGVYLNPAESENKLLYSLSLIAKPIGTDSEWFYFDGDFSTLISAMP